MESVSIDVAAWDSPWRQHHVGAKVLLTLGLVLTALITPAWPGSLLVSAAAVLTMLVWARVPARVVGWSALAPASFLLLGALVVAITVGPTPGGAWLAWGPFSVTGAGLAQAAALLGHGISGTLAILVLATTTPMVDLLTWLRALGIPAPLLDVANLTYRLLFVTLSTTLLVREAMRNRLGDDPLGHGKLRRRWRHGAVLIGAVALRSYHRAARLQAGLELRGFEDDLTTLPRQSASPTAFVALSLAMVAGILLLSWWLS